MLLIALATLAVLGGSFYGADTLTDWFGWPHGMGSKLLMFVLIAAALHIYPGLRTFGGWIREAPMLFGLKKPKSD